MFLSVKEMELRKVRFDETFAPGQIDFSEEFLQQDTPLRVVGAAELLPHTEGEIRIQGKYSVEMASVCDRCLGAARYPLDAAFDLFYRPISFIARNEEVEIDEGEAKSAFTKMAESSWKISCANNCCSPFPCNGSAANPVKASAPIAARTGTSTPAVAPPAGAMRAGALCGILAANNWSPLPGMRARSASSLPCGTRPTVATSHRCAWACLR